MQERWLPAVGFEGLYEVSDLGRVRSVPRIIKPANGAPDRFWKGKVKATPLNRGYPYVTLKRDGRHVTRAVHILVLEAFVGLRPEGHETRHLDGDRGNCTLGNLVWGTSTENKADRKRHGTDNAGSRHGAAKLTEETVCEIRQMRGTATNQQLGLRFGVGAGVISRIQNGRVWRHLLDDPDKYAPGRYG